MTSPRRSRDRPIESVALRISLRADEARTAKIREAVPSVQVRGGVCHLSIEAEDPAEVAEKAKVLLEKLRAAM